ncbi:MAG: alkaline phosphatase, partial [Bryobacterales bacterium]|nr:alkaline phosphatase [Bryobacterales bacterium]
TASEWVTDSAAGMTAIVTGQKTHNGVVSQSASAVRGKSDGEPLKTILEHAEERGLSTGIVTNTGAADATPAACYAHSNDRRKIGEIFVQFLKPRFGDGVEVLVGAGRSKILAAVRELGVDAEAALRERGYTLLDRPGPLPAEARRVVGLYDTGDFDPWEAVEGAIRLLERNRRGYFLMVEWDMHADNLKRGLDRVLQMDEVVRRTAERASRDTLIVFTADHSFDLRLRGGRKGEPLLAGERSAGPENRPYIRVDGSHTGEEVLVAAQGPGAERVRGFISNTDLFRIMMAAYGWLPER